MVGGYFDSIHKTGIELHAGRRVVQQGQRRQRDPADQVGNEVDVPGVLAVFASQTTETDDATGKTIQLKFSDGLVAGGFSGPATASFSGNIWVFTASAGNNIWFGHSDAQNEYFDNQPSSNDVLVGGPLNDYIQAGNGANFIDGGAGNDTLVGGTGNDLLRGGTGNDIVAGGGGDDTYVFDRGDGQDTICDHVA